MSKKSRWFITLVLCLLVALPALANEDCEAVYGNGSHTFSLATGSPGELGMLKALTEVFNPKYDTSLCWQKAGSGKSLQLLKQKKVDIVMVHAPAAEKQAVKEGWAIKRSLIGSNNSILSDQKMIRPILQVSKALQRLMQISRKPRQNFIPVETILAPIKRKWLFGNK